MVISNEIYETSLQRTTYISFEMTTSVRFCLFDPFKSDFITSKMNIVDRDVVSYVACTRQSVTRVVIRFYDTNDNDVNL